MNRNKKVEFKRRAVWTMLLFVLFCVGIGFVPTRHPDTYVSQKAKEAVDEALEGQIEEVKGSLDAADQVKANALELALNESQNLPNRLTAYGALIGFWSLRNPAISALYAKERALETDSLGHYLEAGNRFLNVISVLEEKDKAWAANEALGMFEAVLESDPRHLEARRGKGSALVEGGQQPMQGIQMLRDLLEENPNDVETVLRLAHFSVLSSQFSKALERYRQALTLDSSRTEAYFHLGETWIKLNRKDSAQVYYQRYRETLPAGEARARFDSYLAEVLSISEQH